MLNELSTISIFSDFDAWNFIFTLFNRIFLYRISSNLHTNIILLLNCQRLVETEKIFCIDAVKFVGK